MGLVCKFCGKKFKKEERALRHIVAECGIKDRDKYWKWLVKYSSEVLVDIVNSSLPPIGELTIDQYRAILLLHSIKLINVEGLGLTHEEAEHLLAAYAPEVYVYLLEYIGVIEVTKNGKVRLKKRWT